MKTLSKVYTFLVFTILYIPIVVLVLFSFNSTGNTGSFSGISLYWYRELFSSPETFSALKNTLILAISTAIISTVIGTSAVVGIEKMKSRTIKGSILSVTN
ncbi:MAG: ABC transporter permease, partial [Clostridia bacterium]|nr:ABC transporter permease [Clostridia bacterium]